MIKAYWTAEVANQLGVATVTVRKWASVFEKFGYHFATDEHGRRGFTELDVLLFSDYIELTQKQGMSQEDAVQQCIQKHTHSTAVSLPDMSSSHLIEHYEARYLQVSEQLVEVLQRQDLLLEEIRKRDQIIEDRMNRRDEALMTTLRALSEAATTNRQTSRRWWPFKRKK